MEVDGERLLSIGGVHDFGGSYDLFRVRDATTEFVSTMTFVFDWHGGDPHGEISINGVEISPEEYFAAMENIPTIRLIDQEHSGYTIASPMFMEYLVQPFTREQVMQVFLDYAEKVMSAT